jgi:endonuclease/exonuclease/phosphatase (EEP) superfamily protein YafD
MMLNLECPIPDRLTPNILFSPLRSTLLGLPQPVTAAADLIASDRFSQPAIQASSLTLLNWNIAKNNHHRDWQTDFIQIIQRYQPDILCFQELRLVHPEHCPLALDNMGWHFAPNLITGEDQHQSGVLTASKIQHLRPKVLLSDHTEPVLKTPKVALVTEYSLAGSADHLLLANIHGLNFVRLHKFQTQLTQLATQLQSHPGPIIVSGDFNTWSLGRMRCLQRVVTQLGLKSITFSDTHHRQLKRFLWSAPLDHIFYRGVTPRANSARVLTAVNSSDHKPMVVELML